MEGLDLLIELLLVLVISFVALWAMTGIIDSLFGGGVTQSDQDIIDRQQHEISILKDKVKIKNQKEEISTLKGMI